MRGILLEAARSNKTVTYGHLMRTLGISRGRPLARAISEADRQEYESGRPGFAAIIVRKDTGFPGGGYFCDDDLPSGLRRRNEERSDPRLSLKERKYVTAQQKVVWRQYRWGR
jgi:hypothetical protein